MKIRRSITPRSIQIIIASAVVAGAFFCCGFTVRTLPKGTVVQGVPVGGLTVQKAKSAVRHAVGQGLAQKRLYVCAGAKTYAFAYPQLTFTDALNSLLPQIKKGGVYTANVSYHLMGQDAFICALLQEATPCVEATCSFTGEGFLYDEGQDGYALDGVTLKRDLNAALYALQSQDEATVHAVYTPRLRTRTLQDMQAQTQLLSQFSTNFDASNTSRSHNIAVACARLNGVIVPPQGTFSFNQTVGERSQKNGYLSAKIISGGKFVEGVGGGVCQVSTTVYNAALLSGCEVVEYHPHSLSVSYVSPSRDAMVSGDYCDLKIKNPHAYPVYLSATAKEGVLCCKVYGKPTGCTYRIQSRVNKILPVPPAVVKEGQGLSTWGREGIDSQSYLYVTTPQGEACKLLRHDVYAPVAPVVYQNQTPKHAPSTPSVSPSVPSDGQNTPPLRQKSG